MFSKRKNWIASMMNVEQIQNENWLKKLKYKWKIEIRWTSRYLNFEEILKGTMVFKKIEFVSL